MTVEADRPVESLVDLVAAVQRCSDVVDVVGLALQICRAREAEYWAHHEDWQDQEVALNLAIKRVFDPVDLDTSGVRPDSSWRINSEQKDALASVIGSDEYDAMPLAVAAQAVARALDDAVGPRFGDKFAGSILRVVDGTPYPVGKPDLPKEVTVKELVAPHWRLPASLDSTVHLRLGTSSMSRYEVVIDFRLRSAIAPILPTAGTVIATIHPNARLAELLPPAEQSATKFFGVRPQRSDQLDVIVELIEVARQHYADIIVLPELSVDENVIRELAVHVEKESVRLLVAGSFHYKDSDGNRHNEAIAYIADHPTGGLKHQKIAPFKFGDLEEDLFRAVEPRLTIYASGEWRLAFCICRDLLSKEIRRIYEDLGVNLLFVPALSDEIVSFRDPVGILVTTSQAVSAVANGPAVWIDGARTAHRALFGHPVGPQTTCLVEPAENESAIGVALFRPYDGSIRWIPAPDLEIALEIS